MNKRTFNLAFVKAEIKAKKAVIKFEKEFGNGNQNQQRNVVNTGGGQNNDAQRNIPQQPIYGG